MAHKYKNHGYTISLPESFFSRNVKIFLLALIIAILVVLSVMTKFNFMTVLVIALLTILIIILMNSTTGDNYVGSLPSTTYPIPPHLGLDGVSLENQY